jgi:hypothetical protein
MENWDCRRRTQRTC